MTGRHVDPRAGKVAFRHYAERRCLTQVRRPNTARPHRDDAPTPRLPADRQLNAIRPGAVQAWMRRLGLAPRTVHVGHGIVAPAGTGMHDLRHFCASLPIRGPGAD